MRMSNCEVVAVKWLYEGWARFGVASIRLPDGKTIRREVEDHGAAVAILPYDPERRTTLLVAQLRAAPLVVDGQRETLEVVAGCIEEEDAPETARREALEEAGLRVDSLERVAAVWTMPGVSTERLTLYLAPYAAADRVAAGGGVAAEDENIRVVEMPLRDLAALMDAGDLVDMKTLALTQALRLRRPDLFV
jgi:nudix-type nucleoside diphosphatase (YffH/AdpP family)